MSHTNEPISLLIPAFNAAGHLHDLLNDARQQTLPFAEILVYDDASTDETSSIARKLGAKVITGTENRGAAYARNKLLEASNSEVVHFHDADDRLDPRYCEIVSRFPSGGSNVTLCGAHHLDVRTQRTVASVDWTAINSSHDPVDFFVRRQCAMVVGSYPRRWLLQIGGFKSEFRGGEDYDFHIRLALSGATILAIPDHLVTIRHFGNQSFTERHLLRYLQDNLRVVESHLPLIGEAHREAFGFVLVDLASRLLDQGDDVSCDRALECAVILGRNSISTDSALMDLLSRTMGMKTALTLRVKKNRVLAAFNKLSR